MTEAVIPLASDVPGMAPQGSLDIGSDRYFVIPLSIQQDGADYMVGNADLEEFYQFPAEGVRIIELLRSGLDAARVKTILAREYSDDLDVDDFIASLVEIGFVYPADEVDGFKRRLARQPSDRRLTFACSPAVARALLSPATLLLYVAVIGIAGYKMVADPALRPDWGALALEHDITLTMIPLLLLYACTVSFHELGHMLAAARYGVRSKLGIGNRLWAIVAEADLSGIHALPKRQRYLPLLAGMLTDLFTISVTTLVIAGLLAQGGHDYLTQLLKALVLQIIITLTWQFNIFLRTDVYYVLCTHLNYPDLDSDARLYLGELGHRLSGGRFGKAAPSAHYKQRSVLRMFAGIWLLGRLMAVTMLIFVLIPTLVHYVAQAYRTFRDPTAPFATVVDQICFLAISLTLFGTGMIMWLKRRLMPTRGEEQRI
ncbi:hypothetical protein [Sphingosinicella sp. BN140058]|uniref:hypothetical protein n=1 Tax=Sphingosinicella sp. BN140058 TaxID=1892855 RepID=UPI00101036B5|nr:hypothetical protein [Sphingosinicella sp. BN140058]QAY76230.1 hypothetical protein ETR14_06550 [Sphingosinicella sp. BN140058]